MIFCYTPWLTHVFFAPLFRLIFRGVTNETILLSFWGISQDFCPVMGFQRVSIGSPCVPLELVGREAGVWCRRACLWLLPHPVLLLSILWPWQEFPANPALARECTLLMCRARLSICCTPGVWGWGVTGLWVMWSLCWNQRQKSGRAGSARGHQIMTVSFQGARGAIPGTAVWMLPT